MEETREHSSGFLSGLFLGGIAGAVSFFLFGTKEGKKIKKVLLKEGRELLEEMEEVTDKIKEAKEKPVVQEAEIKSKKPVQKKLSPPRRFFRRAGAALR